LGILKQFLIVFGFAAVALALYYGLKYLVLDKVKVKLWYIIIAFTIILLFPFITLLFYRHILPQWVYSLQMVLVTIVFLVYLETRKKEKIQRNKPIIGRPKPKPNRLKNK
jgi:hypothetical protein